MENYNFKWSRVRLSKNKTVVSFPLVVEYLARQVSVRSAKNIRIQPMGNNLTNLIAVCFEDESPETRV